MNSLMILGATGLVGGHALAQATADPRVGRIVAPTRRPLDPPRPGVENPPLDVAALEPGAPWWSVDAVICALGSTRREAGSAEAFRALDHGAVVEALGIARRHGCRVAAVVSSVGADADARALYLRTKGQMELDAARLGFESLTLLRPALLEGDRPRTRPLERAAGVAMRTLAPLVPRRYRAVRAERVAHALLASVIAARPGVHIVESELL
ncbi:NAD-dependent dehydratase [Coralloluteibacterium thermophilus]|uniref:NAD-dependent dehydratase n=1 Tax=Coralloluteibacterium thermophilum TaxID=2707049 RepID=A0ABV9NJG0_9GAMM